MEKNFLWISNGSKPKPAEYLSREKARLGNVSAPAVEAALRMGYTVYMGKNRKYAEELECDYPVRFYDASVYRSLLDLKSNLKAYKNLMNLLKRVRIDVIHCNTPIGGALGRICGKKARVPKVIYTVHGFHFYKGAPLLNRTVLKWAERFMARYTDAIITINREDYEAALKFKLRGGGKVYYLPGVGVNTGDYRIEGFDKAACRAGLGLNQDDVVLISMGDLIKRKNYEAAIKAVAKAENQKLVYLICGKGPKDAELKQLAKNLGVEDRVRFLGFRRDIKELLQIADIFLFTTLQEGLPRSMMEAMSAGLPCVASKIRGNVDLIEDGKGGFLRVPNDMEGFAAALNTLAGNPAMREDMKRVNLETIQKYDVENIKKLVADIYAEQL